MSLKPHHFTQTIRGLVIGFLSGVSLLGFSYWCSTLPAISDVSLKWASTPWWRNWGTAAVLFVLSVSIGVFLDFLRNVR